MQELLNQLARLAAVPAQIEELRNTVTGATLWLWLWGLVTLGFAYATKWRADRAMENTRKIMDEIKEIKAAILTKTG